MKANSRKKILRRKMFEDINPSFFSSCHLLIRLLHLANLYSHPPYRTDDSGCRTKELKAHNNLKILRCG